MASWLPSPLMSKPRLNGANLPTFYVFGLSLSMVELDSPNGTKKSIYNNYPAEFQLFCFTISGFWFAGRILKTTATILKFSYPNIFAFKSCPNFVSFHACWYRESPTNDLKISDCVHFAVSKLNECVRLVFRHLVTVFRRRNRVENFGDIVVWTHGLKEIHKNSRQFEKKKKTWGMWESEAFCRISILSVKRFPS